MEHNEDCCFSNETFCCDDCGQDKCYCQGHWDSMPEICTDCWWERKIAAKKKFDNG